MTYQIGESAEVVSSINSLEENDYKEAELIKSGGYDTCVISSPNKGGFKRIIKNIFHMKGTYGEIPPSTDEIIKTYYDYMDEKMQKTSNSSNTN